MAEPLLRVENLVRRFGGVLAADNVSLDVVSGELHAIIGPNGAGKTTLISQLTGQLTPNSGTIRFAGQDITSAARLPPQPARAGALVPDHLVACPISPRPTMSRWRRRRMTGTPSGSGRNARKEKHLRDAAQAALERVGLEQPRRHAVSELSHGEQRELELAVALATKPQLLLLDEPMAGLGATESARMVELLQGIAQARSPSCWSSTTWKRCLRSPTASRVLVYGRVIASRQAGRNPQQRRGEARLSRRSACGGAHG